MIRTLLMLAAGIGVGVAVTFAGDHDHHKAAKVTQLSQRDIVEKLDGKENVPGRCPDHLLTSSNCSEAYTPATGWQD